MQENYEDGTKGEIKFVDWANLLEEIKTSLNKDGVKSVTVSKSVALDPKSLLKIEEENKGLLEELAELINE